MLFTVVLFLVAIIGFFVVLKVKTERVVYNPTKGARERVVTTLPKVYLLIPLILLLLSGSIFVIRCLVITEPGEVQVVKLFGKLSPTPIANSPDQSVFFVNPFADRISFSVKVIERKEHFEAISKDNMTIPMDVSFWYHLVGSKAPYIYRTYDSEKAWNEGIATPTLRGAVRDISAKYDGFDLVTISREAYIAELIKYLSPQVVSIGGQLDGIKLRDMQLPKPIKDAVESKMIEKQNAEKMVYTLQKAQQEAERKRIESDGIKNFTASLTPLYIRWCQIEAYKLFADAKTTTMLIMPEDMKNVPIMMNK